MSAKKRPEPDHAEPDGHDDSIATEDLDEEAAEEDLTELVATVLDGFKFVLDHPRFKELLEYRREGRHQTHESAQFREAHNAKQLTWALWIKAGLLLVSIGVILTFGLTGTISGEALVGLLAAYVGYLWGDRRSASG